MATSEEGTLIVIPVDKIRNRRKTIIDEKVIWELVLFLGRTVIDIINIAIAIILYF